MSDGTENEDPEYDVNVRERPEAYEIGRGEEGVFAYQPYKDELLPLWTIESLKTAEGGAEAIFERYREYRKAGEFPGMDMARKYLQMGWTRALRYAKYPGGRKYDEGGNERDPEEWYDEEKREISLVYKEYLDRVREDETYREMRETHRERRG